MGYRQKALESNDGRCDRCGDPVVDSDIEVHHVDHDRSNDSLDNLECLCHGCHVEEHHGDAPIWGIVVSMPRPVLDAVDRVKDERGYSSRSETINRLVAESVPGDPDAWMTADESVSAWFGGDTEGWLVEKEVAPNG